MVTTAFSDYPGPALGLASAVQVDGKIVVAGSAGAQNAGAGSGIAALARYNPDGTLDTSFGDGGRVTTSFPIWPKAAFEAVAIQADGKIVAGGVAWSLTSGDFALARYNPDGTLDATFGNGGRVLVDFGPLLGETPYDQLGSLVIQADGKIVGLGYTEQRDVPSDFALVRLNTDGSLDASFGTGGRVVTDFGVADIGNHVVMQPDGKLVAVGYSGYSDGRIDLTLARYGPDGSLDPSFGTGGKVTRNFGPLEAVGRSGVLQADGRLVVGGRVGNGGTSNDFVLTRFNTDGSLDTSFGTGGLTTTDFGGYDDINGIAFQSTGKIVAAGYTQASSAGVDFAVARYNPDGSPDPSFGTGGKVTTDFGGNDRAYGGVVIQTDDKVIVAGFTASPDFSSGSFALARYLGDTRAAPTVTAAGGSFVYDEQPHPATGSVGGVGGEDLGAPTFTYYYQDGDGNWVITGSGGADPPVDPGYYKAVGSFAGNANYLPASAEAYVTVAYEARTLTDLSHAFHAGRTIPIKIQLLDAAGNNVSAAGIDLSAIRLERVNADGSITQVSLQDAGNANPGNLFRYDPTLGGYIFNLSTRGLAAGTYRFFWVAGDDPTEHELGFRLV